MEKLKPQKQRSVISSLKFQRKTDYKKFLKFIKLETKRLKGIEKPKESKVKDILNAGTIGLSAFGIFSLIGKGRDAINKIKGVQDDFQTPFAVGRVRDTDLKKTISINDSIRTSPINKKKFSPFISQKIKVKEESPFFKEGKKIDKTIGFKQESFLTDKTSAVKKKFAVVGGESNLRGSNLLGASAGDKDFFKRLGLDPKFGKRGYGKNNLGAMTGDTGKSFGKINTSSVDDFIKKNPNLTPREAINAYLNLPDFEADELMSRAATDIGMGKKVGVEALMDEMNNQKELRMDPSYNRVTIKAEMLFEYTKRRLKQLGKGFINFYNKGRTSAEDTMKFFGKKGLIADDFSKITRTDKAFKEGAKGLKGARPFKAFTPRMLKTGPTPLTRQLIERPFKSLFRAGSGISKILFNNPLVNALLKSKVTKTGLFVIDAIFAGQEFYDLFMRPGDNVYTTLHDLYVSINNAYFQNDPEKLKYFITESKGSSKLFGIGPGLTNEQIRKKEIERNLKIKRLKEAAAVEAGSGGNNVIVVPQSGNKRGSGISNNSPTQTGGNEISFVPFEPLNIGDDILLHKLNQ